MWAGTLSRPRPITEALQQVDLTQRADVRVRSLSGGERRRLDLAMALLGQPRVVVMDEPTTGLDPESRRSVWHLIRGVVAGGGAVVLTIHDLEEAEELADRIAVMRDGRIVLAGTSAEIAASQPATIRFSLRDDAPPLPSLPGVHGATPPPRVELRTQALQATLSRLLAWATELTSRWSDCRTGPPPSSRRSSPSQTTGHRTAPLPRPPEPHPAIGVPP